MYRCDLILCKSLYPYSHGSLFGSLCGKARQVQACAPVVYPDTHHINVTDFPVKQLDLENL